MSSTVSYRVTGFTLTKRCDTGEDRVVVTAVDAGGEVVQWSAQTDRVPALGAMVDVTVALHQENPKDDGEGKGDDGK